MPSKWVEKGLRVGKVAKLRGKRGQSGENALGYLMLIFG